MPRALVLALLAAALLSGCISEGETGPPEPTEETGAEAADEPRTSIAGVLTQGNSSSNMTVRTFAQHYGRDESALGIAGGHNGFGGTNCIALDDAMRILRGNATIVWSADEPNVFDMELFLDVRGQGAVALAVGPSPLHIDFADVEVPGGTTEVMLVWQLSSDEPVAVAYEVHGELDLAFDYVGQDASPDDGWSCAHGR